MTVDILVPKRWVHVLDAMCGSGGTFDGTSRALRDRGFGVRAVAVNHWSKAIASHQANHPDVKHFTEGIDDVDIERIVDEYLDGYVDYLCISPECDDFSRAKGGKPVTDQRRHHAHFLISAIAKVPVRRVFVENVWEFTKWGPLCELSAGHSGKHNRQWPPAKPGERCNKRLKGRDDNGLEYEGQTFQAWLSDIHHCGWDFRYWPINAADYGAPTTRERFIGMGCREKGGVFFPAPTHCDPKRMPAPDMFGQSTLKSWNTAESVIRKERLGASLLTSKSKRKDGKIRSPKTLLRVGRGAFENWGAIGSIIVDALTERGLPDDSKVVLAARSVIAGLPKDESGVPVLDISFAESNAVVLSQHGGGAPDSDAAPVPAITHGGAHTISRALVTPYYGATQKSSTDATPLDTITAKDRFSIDRARLLPIVSAQRGNNVARSATEPIQTITSIPTMMLVLQAQLKPFVSAQRSHNVARSSDQPVHTITSDMNMLVSQADIVAISEDAIIVENFGEREDQLPRYYTDKKPVASVTQRGAGDINRVSIQNQVAGVSRKRLVRGLDGRLYAVDICSRMFDVDELLEAQGCPPGYIVVGTKTEQKEQVGNMVCPPITYAFVGAQEDADAKMIVMSDRPTTSTPLPPGRLPASIRTQRKGEVA